MEIISSFYCSSAVRVPIYGVVLGAKGEKREGGMLVVGICGILWYQEWSRLNGIMLLDGWGEIRD